MQNAFTFTFSEVWISITELSFKMYAMKHTDVTAKTFWCIKNTIKNIFTDENDFHITVLGMPDINNHTLI
jgi:hypothetical protein